MPLSDLRILGVASAPPLVLQTNEPHMDPQDVLVNNVRDLLRFSRKTQGDLADAIGVTQGRVSQILSGRGSFKVTQLGRLADCLMVSPADLFRSADGKFERRRKERRSGGDRRLGATGAL